MLSQADVSQVAFLVMDLLAKLGIFATATPQGHPASRFWLQSPLDWQSDLVPARGLCTVMEDRSVCVLQLEGVRLADPSKTMDGSSESVYLTALSENIVEGTESSERGRSVEEQIEQSKVHWSALAEFNNGEGEEEAEVSNVKVFEELQRHPVWGTFFHKFNLLR